MAPEAWWRRAVFYRMDPARFQDGSGNGKGDLQGIVQRLNYLQSVGVDALLLDGSFDADGLEDLVREASRHHLRVVIALNPALLQGPHDTLLNTVHGWLGAGVAGVALPPAGRVTAAGGGYPALAASLRQMLQSLPGERVLLSDPIPGAAISAPAPLRKRERGGATATTPGHGGQLVTAAALPVAGGGCCAVADRIGGRQRGGGRGNEWSAAVCGRSGERLSQRGGRCGHAAGLPRRRDLRLRR